jgi:hypothetical protein
MKEQKTSNRNIERELLFCVRSMLKPEINFGRMGSILSITITSIKKDISQVFLYNEIKFFPFQRYKRYCL